MYLTSVSVTLNVPAPEAVKSAIMKSWMMRDPGSVHGYTNINAGYEDVRKAVADSLNRFGTSFAANNITMTVLSRRGTECHFEDTVKPWG